MSLLEMIQCVAEVPATSIAVETSCCYTSVTEHNHSYVCNSEPKEDTNGRSEYNKMNNGKNVNVSETLQI